MQAPVHPNPDVENTLHDQDTKELTVDPRKLKWLTSEHTKRLYTKERKRPLSKAEDWLRWYASWAIPGLGMFSEAYIIFSLGLIKPLQKAEYPGCFTTYTDCPEQLTTVQNFVQICGIIAGMLVFGALGDVIGRKWGSRMTASIMLSGAILLVFTALVPSPLAYLRFFIFAQTLYGFGVGGEYPMASASAAERSQEEPNLRSKRGQQVVLTFSQQGMGNLVNACVIIVCLAIFGQAGKRLDPVGSRNVIIVQFAVGAAVALFMAVWRFTRLKESKVWSVERQHAGQVATEAAHGSKPHMYTSTLRIFWPRLLATCLTWAANDFAFYGNRLFQSTFIALLYPDATEFQRLEWTILNAAVALVGYYCAAYFVDKPYYGRKKMMGIGFLMMFLLFIVCGAAFGPLTGSALGLHAFQALYMLSSFWNQFGPNCTTWLVAAEVFPTHVRTTFQGVSSASGKVGAIIADILFSYVTQRTTFFLSAAFGLFGALMTWVFLPDTTGLPLEELDRMHKYALAKEWGHYHGEAINPKYLSFFERHVLHWDRNYHLGKDQQHKRIQMSDSAADLGLLKPGAGLHRRTNGAAPAPAGSQA